MKRKEKVGEALVASRGEEKKQREDLKQGAGDHEGRPYEEKGRGSSPVADSSPSKIQNPTSNIQKAGAAVTFFGGTAQYLFGASAADAKGAPWLVHRAAIEEARRRGCRWYDLMGIPPEPFFQEGKWRVWLGDREKLFKTEEAARHFCEKEHSFAGVGFFKTRWGGERRDWVGAWEKVFRPGRFRLLLFLKKIRRWLRACKSFLAAR